MRLGTDVFAGLSKYSCPFHVLVGLKARGTLDPRKHLCLFGEDSSGGRHLGLARRASARWSSQQVFSPVEMQAMMNLDPTCTSLMNMMMSSTRGVLVTGEDTCDHEASTIERTRRRVSSAMFVSFGASLRGAVGPIEDGTDVFAGQDLDLELHMHDDPDGRHDLYMWSTQPAKACVTGYVR
jgi:hypothetical protein